MKQAIRLCLIAGIALVAWSSNAEALTYYVNSSTGSDGNDGMSPTTPWRHLSNVNNTVFQPNDKILLAAGGVWNEQLYPKGSGTPGNFITIDMYGTGRKPIINGQGNVNAAVFLHNQHDWLVQNLEVTNTAALGNTNNLSGIKVRNSTGGLLSHIVIKDVHVHSINGVVNGFYGQNAGIAVTADVNLSDPVTGPHSYWSDVTIHGATMYAVDRIGIYVGPDNQQTAVMPYGLWPTLPSTSYVTIANNIIDDAGGDGILVFVVQNATISNNIVSNSGSRLVGSCAGWTTYCNGAAVAIWSVISTNVVFQYNEVYGFMMKNTQNPPPGDGQAFDADLGSKDSTFQYNYSHGNRSGMFLLFDGGDSLGIDNLKIRYNVSYSDFGSVFVVIGPLNSGPHVANINNNTVYVPAGTLTRMFGVNLPEPGNARIYNNLFVYSGGSPSTVYFPFDAGANITYDANTYYVTSGNHPTDEPGLAGNPADSHKSTLNPLLACPGCASNGTFTLDGMKLRANSPALLSGSNAGNTSMGYYDLWANPVAASGAPNRGAYDGSGVSGVPDTDLAFHAVVTPSSSYEAQPWSLNNVIDGQTSSVAGLFGYSSQIGQASNHTESIVIDLRAVRTFDKIVLYPRNDTGNIGAGFPVDFTIQVWDGANWLTRVTQTSYPQPGNSGQVFTLNQPDTTNGIRIVATNLRQVGGDYVMQFAEIQVFDSNQLIGANVNVDSSYEADGWSATHIDDGLRSSLSYSLGYSSGFAFAGINHTETIYLTTPSPKIYSSVVLYPRNDSGMVGDGFPIDFTISFWNGTGWDVKVARTGYPKPGNAGQTFTWGSSYTTDKVRIQGTNLRTVQGSYLLQLAEIEAYR